jgi:anti-sigma28 factor (negative regulator of flagellin synthesis)
MRAVCWSRAINSEKQQPAAAESGEESKAGSNEQANKTPEQLAREQKIAALKRAVESGTYRIKSDKVAEAIISEIAKREK